MVLATTLIPERTNPRKASTDVATAYARLARVQIIALCAKPERSEQELLPHAKLHEQLRVASSVY